MKLGKLKWKPVRRLVKKDMLRCEKKTSKEENRKGELGKNNRNKIRTIQGAAKKMTQHVKCDYLVTPENFCAKFGRIV